MDDGTQKLCKILYGRDAQPKDYLGGSDAKMLHDAVDAIYKAFIDGAKWWEYESTGGTMWQSDQYKTVTEAERRYNHGKI